MGSAVQIPVENYLDGSFDLEVDPEYVDGELEERPMGEWDHSTWQDALLAWFRENGKEWGIRARPELRVQVSPTRYRLPDVVVVSRTQPVEQTLHAAPLAVIEILSPEDRMSRVLVKLRDYETMGIRAIRVVDPRTSTLYKFESGTLKPIKSTTETLSDDPLCLIDWDAVVRLLD
jgi:Uma2 family endonuclease